jgi:hypothetical protein
VTQTRKQQRAAGGVVPDTEYPLAATENQPAVLHCDRCEMGETLHLLWRSVDGFPLTVRCVRHAGDR